MEIILVFTFVSMNKKKNSRSINTYLVSHILFNHASEYIWVTITYFAYFKQLEFRFIVKILLKVSELYTKRNETRSKCDSKGFLESFTFLYTTFKQERQKSSSLLSISVLGLNYCSSKYKLSSRIKFVCTYI